MQLQCREGARGTGAEVDIGHEAVLESMVGMTVVWTRTMPKVTMLPGWEHSLFPWRQGPASAPPGLQTHPPTRAAWWTPLAGR